MSEIPEDISKTAVSISLCHTERQGCVHPDEEICGEENRCVLVDSIEAALIAERECCQREFEKALASIKLVTP